MSTPNEASATNARMSPVDRAVRTGPGRATSANRAKIKFEDAALAAADRANSSAAAARMDGNANVPT